MSVWQVLFALSMAVLGAILSYVVQVFFRSRRYRKLGVLFGPWISAYQTLDTGERNWVGEAVQIDLHDGQIRVTNSNNSRNYSYVATTDLVGNRYLHGEWLSGRGKDADHGVLVLKISKDHDIIYGYWTGPNVTESTQFVGWVLAKVEPDIERAREVLKSASQTFPQAPHAA